MTETRLDHLEGADEDIDELQDPSRAIDTAATDEPGDDSEDGYVGQEIATGPGGMGGDVRRDRDQAG